MQSARQSSNQQRRRRVLLDENVSGRAARRTAASPPEEGERPYREPYSVAARHDRQARVTDLIPLRPYKLFLGVLLGLVAVAAVLNLHVARAEWRTAVPQVQFSALNLQAEANLANWLSSGMLLLAAAYAGLTWAIRRHRADDYRGRYRVWLWAAVCLLVLSIDAATHLHRLVQGLLVHATGLRLAPHGGGWWMAAYAAALALVAVIVAIDMRRCRAAITALVAAGLGYATAAVVQLGLLEPGHILSWTLVYSAVVLAAHMLLMVAMMASARYVFLEAHGLLPVRETSSDGSCEDQPNRRSRRRELKRGGGEGASPQNDAAADAGSKNKTKRRRTDLDAEPMNDPEKPADPAAPERRRKKKTRSASSQSESRPVGDDSAASRQTAKNAGAKPQPTVKVAHEADDHSDSDTQRPMSKAERRRLRKEKRRQNRAA